MFRIDADVEFPPLLCGHVLLDNIGLPQYWPKAWSAPTKPTIGYLEISKIIEHVRCIEELYCFADDSLKGPGSIDEFISIVCHKHLYVETTGEL